MPLMLAPLLSGAAISLTGHYVPLMYIGGILAATGAGLITTFTATTSFAAVIGFQVMAGLGGGLCHQIPYTSILHVLPPRDLVAGSALCSFLNSLGSILGIVISQTVFANLLQRNLGEVPGADTHGIIEAGPTKIDTVVGPADVGAVRDAYGGALREAFFLPAVAAALCCVCATAMEWKRIKN
jgi:MFS family permease